MKIGMTRGTKRILDLGRRQDAGLDATLVAGIDEAIDGSIEETVSQLVHSMPCGEGTLQFFIDADIDKIILGASFLTKVMAIDAQSMSIYGVPETKRTQHQGLASKGFDAREVVDMDLLEGIQIIRVVDAGAGSTLYLLDHGWNILLTDEECDLCY